MIVPVIIFGMVALSFAVSITIKYATRQKEKYDRDKAIQEKYEKRYRNLMSNENGETGVMWSPYYSFQENFKAEMAMKQRVLDMPQLTFERWLTFYNNKPEAWTIQKDEDRIFANIPYYTQEIQHENKYGKTITTTNYVPIFWENATEMRKYREWVETEYQGGRAAVFEKAREKNMRTLIDIVEADIKANRAQTEAELAKMRDEIRTSTPRKEPLTLKLSNGVEVPVEPTYQGMPITKYNGQATAAYALESRVSTPSLKDQNGEPLKVIIVEHEQDLAPYQNCIYISQDTGKQYLSMQGRLVEISQRNYMNQAKQANPFGIVKCSY